MLVLLDQISPKNFDGAKFGQIMQCKECSFSLVKCFPLILMLPILDGFSIASTSQILTFRFLGQKTSKYHLKKRGLNNTPPLFKDEITFQIMWLLFSNRLYSHIRSVSDKFSKCHRRCNFCQMFLTE